MTTKEKAIAARLEEIAKEQEETRARNRKAIQYFISIGIDGEFNEDGYFVVDNAQFTVEDITHNRPRYRLAPVDERYRGIYTLSELGDYFLEQEKAQERRDKTFWGRVRKFGAKLVRILATRYD